MQIRNASGKFSATERRRNTGMLPVRRADMLSALRDSAGYKPAGRTDYKSVFLFVPTADRLRNPLRHVRPKDNGANDSRRNRGQKHRTGGNILRIANQRMKLWRRSVRQKFERRVQSLCRPDDRDSQNDPTPITRRNAQEEGGRDRHNCSRSMNPCVMLAADHPQDAIDRVAKTANATRKLKRLHC